LVLAAYVEQARERVRLRNLTTAEEIAARIDYARIFGQDFITGPDQEGIDPEK
jgi:hypothetical protein